MDIDLGTVDPHWQEFQGSVAWFGPPLVLTSGSGRHDFHAWPIGLDDERLEPREQFRPDGPRGQVDLLTQEQVFEALKENWFGTSGHITQ